MGEWVRENGGESETMGEGVSVSTNAGEACGYAYDPVLFICASHCCCYECVPAVLLSPMRAQRAQSWVGVWPVRMAVVCRLSFVVRRPWPSFVVCRSSSVAVTRRVRRPSSPFVAVPLPAFVRSFVCRSRWPMSSLFVCCSPPAVCCRLVLTYAVIVRHLRVM
ncbi:hypothetical protein BOTBODRAFT_52457 [Botryobasidium botryosum FD-172 SS1]|uniref:Uncharacterized protein n=1 Tax=Botryobasidium botryosum (strain FD-172 SS1) TaxID=930990 RepID=A0A067MRQ7_BOTB1|nr:hypothetical protein BOTBODRAFT_52457 [Botryobasidium botryosum FD-172 SS1]